MLHLLVYNNLMAVKDTHTHIYTLVSERIRPDTSEYHQNETEGFVCLCVCVWRGGGGVGAGSCLEGTIVKEKLCQNPGIEQFVVCVQLHLSHFNLSKPQSTGSGKTGNVGGQQKQLTSLILRMSFRHLLKL